MADNWNRRAPGSTNVPSQLHIDEYGKRCRGCRQMVMFLSDRRWCDDCEGDNLVEIFKAKMGVGLNPDEPLDGYR